MPNYLSSYRTLSVSRTPRPRSCARSSTWPLPPRRRAPGDRFRSTRRHEPLLHPGPTVSLAENSLAGLAILIVEDEPLLRRQLTSQLERLGMDVTGAGVLGAARQLIAELGFDFVLLDVHLPDGDGTDLLRERAFSANTGVIVMTANGAVSGDPGLAARSSPP